MTNSDTIKQITSADGWAAVMFCEEEPYYYLDPLAVWAMIANTYGNTRVVGMTGALETPEGQRAFYTYTNLTHIKPTAGEHWRNKGKRWVEERESKP